MSQASKDKEPHKDKAEPDGNKRKRDAHDTEQVEAADRATESDDSDNNQLHQQKARAMEPQDANAAHAAASVVVPPESDVNADDSDADLDLQMALVNSIHDIGVAQQNKIALDEGLKRSSSSGAATNSDHHLLNNIGLLDDENFDEPDEFDGPATPQTSEEDEAESTPETT